MKIWSKQNLTGAGSLIGAMMIANVLNFIYNTFLGRALSFEQFGVVIFYNTILNVSAIAFSSLGTTINHRVSYLNGKYDEEAGSAFTRFVRTRAFLAASLMMITWLAMAMFISKWFNIPNIESVILFSPIFFFGFATAVNRGYLQGNLLFFSLGLTLIIEPFVKLLAALGFVYLHWEEHVHLSIPIALFSSFALATLFVLRKTKTHIGENQFKFPKRFYSAALINGMSTAAFLSLDVLLAKHYLSPELAGQYSLLSVIGGIVYFGGSILNGLIITFVSHDAGGNANPLKTFYKILLGTSLITISAVIVVGVFGSFTAPLLFGAKALLIVPYLPTYAFAVGLFTFSTAIIAYHLARQHYSFSIAVLALPIILSLNIYHKHSSLNDLVHAYIITSIIGTSLILFLHSIQRNGRFVLANLVDLGGVFMKFQPQEKLAGGGKRILIMNWRDTKHKYAGGAEVYIQELAKRWVVGGNQVTIFCGNDGHAERDETIDGIRIIRRGGFYFVYVWAFIYYVTRFRGRFDVIIDCQNGVPFFTPLYAKEKIYSVMHHVHQEVFYKYLPKRMAWLASVLENRAMPYVYRKVKFIAVSPSTKKEMEELDLVGNGIEIIYNGVDHHKLTPGTKSPDPTILYLGRLKAYKSIDVLIRAFKEISEKIYNVKLIIAGSGDEEQRLRELTDSLGVGHKVEFTGQIDDDQKISLLQSAWVFVNPSLMEGWGITTIEANACGTPVVASDVPGLRDSVQNPHSGFLVAYGDSKLLAKRIEQLLADNQLRAKMSKNAIEWAHKFSWDKSANRGLLLIKELI
jgi:glycosyltransferase involved in cell wall biosynthesis/O-antigen/teichoic acid export membrane protein